MHREPDEHHRAEQPADLRVPRLCMTNSPIRMMSVSGMMSGSKHRLSDAQSFDGASTEIAGVSMPSP